MTTGTWTVRLTLDNGRVDDVTGFACREAAEIFVIRVRGNRHVVSALIHYCD